MMRSNRPEVVQATEGKYASRASDPSRCASDPRCTRRLRVPQPGDGGALAAIFVNRPGPARVTALVGC